MTAKTIEPFLKWAGGKRWLVNKFREIFPSVSGRHIEPFAGSAAVFFALQPENAILSDLNSRLVETYAAIRDDPHQFEKLFSWFAQNHSEDFYYQTRQQVYTCSTKRAAQFLYLNRVCFNGIYRENLKGEFNVPIGSKTSALLSTDNFKAVSALLQRVELFSGDFEIIVNKAVSGDFLYIDPPYTTKHNLNGFVKYNQNIFSWADQERLADAVIRAINRGATVVVSNADHAEVRALYKDCFVLSSVTRTNVIASKSEHRGKISELIATSVNSGLT